MEVIAVRNDVEREEDIEGEVDAKDEATCHKLCTATAHGRPTLLRTDLFETEIGRAHV